MRTLLLVMVLVLASPLMAAPKSPFVKYHGYWVGKGYFATNGKRERIKCRVIYRSKPRTMKQTIRCGTRDLRVEIISRFQLGPGGRILGQFHIQPWNIAGRASGGVVKGGMRLRLKSDTTSGKVNVKFINSRQHKIVVNGDAGTFVINVSK